MGTLDTNVIVRLLIGDDPQQTPIAERTFLEAGEIICKGLQPEPGMKIYDPCCGSGGLLVKCKVAMEERARGGKGAKVAPLKLYCQEYVTETWAMANMNMIIHL